VAKTIGAFGEHAMGDARDGGGSGDDGLVVNDVAAFRRALLAGPGAKTRRADGRRESGLAPDAASTGVVESAEPSSVVASDRDPREREEWFRRMGAEERERMRRIWRWEAEEPARRARWLRDLAWQDTWHGAALGLFVVLIELVFAPWPRAPLTLLVLGPVASAGAGRLLAACGGGRFVATLLGLVAFLAAHLATGPSLLVVFYGAWMTAAIWAYHGMQRESRWLDGRPIDPGDPQFEWMRRFTGVGARTQLQGLGETPATLGRDRPDADARGLRAVGSPSPQSDPECGESRGEREPRVAHGPTASGVRRVLPSPSPGGKRVEPGSSAPSESARSPGDLGA
jgi:hypothetical protein